MRSWLVGIALTLTVVVVGGAVVAGVAAGQAPYPPCPPGAAPIPPPNVTVRGDPGSPGRFVAGRPFSIEYGGESIVEETTGPPGTTFSSNDLIGATVIVAAPGPAVFTARYHDDRVGCSQTFSYTVTVEAGDVLSPRGGYADGPVGEIGRFARLPRKGALTSQAPVAGVQFICTDTTGPIPVVAELRVERNLRRAPSAASPGATMTVADPCRTTGSAVLAPGARLRHVRGEIVAVEHRFRRGARYWLRITQAGRVLLQLRYYVAFGRKQTMFVQKAWVIAPDAAFQAARCRKRARGDTRDPLGYQNYPIPPCPR
jgi:hemin uptake protein HemP